MHLSDHPWPEPIKEAREKVKKAVGHLASVRIVRSECGNQDIQVRLKDDRAWDPAVKALIKMGAEEDGMRGPEIFAYKGNMIILIGGDPFTHLTLSRGEKQ